MSKVEQGGELLLTKVEGHASSESSTKSEPRARFRTARPPIQTDPRRNRRFGWHSIDPLRDGAVARGNIIRVFDCPRHRPRAIETIDGEKTDLQRFRAFLHSFRKIRQTVSVESFLFRDSTDAVCGISPPTTNRCVRQRFQSYPSAHLRWVPFRPSSVDDPAVRNSLIEASYSC